MTSNVFCLQVQPVIHPVCEVCQCCIYWNYLCKYSVSKYDEKLFWLYAVCGLLSREAILRMVSICIKWVPCLWWRWRLDEVVLKKGTGLFTEGTIYLVVLLEGVWLDSSPLFIGEKDLFLIIIFLVCAFLFDRHLLTTPI